MIENKSCTIPDSFFLFVIVSAFIGVAVSYSIVYLFHASLFVLVLAVFVSGKITYLRPATSYHYFFIFFFCWYVLSILWSENRAYALKYTAYIFLGIVVVYIIVFTLSTEDRLLKLFKILAVFAFLNLFAGLLESLTSFRMPVSPFSELLGYLGRPELTLEGYTDRQVEYLLSMPTGFNWNPNNFSVCVNMIFPFFILHRKKIIKIAGTAVCFFLIVKAGSRGNMVAFFIILFSSFLLNRDGKITFYSIFRTVVLIILVYAGVFILLPSILERFSIRAGNIYELLTIFDALKAYLDVGSANTTSIGIRGRLIINGLHALRESYYLGVGAGNSLVVQEQLGMKTLSMHNFWIELLVEGGLFFFIILVIWYVSLTYKLMKIQFNNRVLVYLSRCFFLALVGFLFSAVSASSTIYFLPMYLMFGFSVGLVNLSVREGNNENTACKRCC